MSPEKLSPRKLHLEAPLQAVRLTAHGEEDVRDALVDAARSEGARAAAAHFDKAVEQMRAQEQDIRNSLARSAAEIAVEIARVILRRHIDDGDYGLELIVRETLEASAVGRGPCVVHLNPDDLTGLSGVRFRSGTRFEADEGVARGDVHVETQQGLLVRDVEGSLEAIRKRLQEEMG